MEMLERRGIPYNAIAVVTKATLEDPDSFFEFFYARRKALTDFHFNVLASPIGDEGKLSYGPNDRELFHAFYCRLMDFWTEKQATGDGMPIRNFSQALDRISGYGLPGAPAYFEESTAPLRSLNMDTKGTLTTFYAGLDPATDRHRYGDDAGFSLGNMREQSLGDMLTSPKLAAMMSDFARCHDACRSACEYLPVCPGGFELTQLQANEDGAVCNPETVECLIHVKAMTDAVLDKLVHTVPDSVSHTPERSDSAVGTDGVAIS
jgi:uncharacterized protein